MANFTITISNSMRTFGPAPSDKWGVGAIYTFTWGVSKWGEGTEGLTKDYEKPHAETLTLAGATLTFDTAKRLSAQTLSLLSETYSETLQTANGYYYTFIKPTSEAEQRNISTYTKITPVTPTYSSGSTAGTVWQ